MKSFVKFLAACGLATVWLAGTSALAGDRDWQKYDGSVKIESTQFALIIGGATGGGTLTFQGKDYPFKISGLTAGINVGVTKTEAAGFVYDLKDVSKFAGTYTAFSASGTMGAGAGEVYLKNENGVIMKLGATGKGLQLNVGSASGVKVTMK
jgi:hypothetical protein